MHRLLKKTISYDFKILWGETEDGRDKVEIRGKKEDGTGWELQDALVKDGLKNNFTNYCKKRLGI